MNKQNTLYQVLYTLNLSLISYSFVGWEVPNEHISRFSSVVIVFLRDDIPCLYRNLIFVFFIYFIISDIIRKNIISIL